MDDTALRIRTARLSDAPALLKIYAPYVEKTAITFECTVPDIEEFAARMRATLRRYPYLVAERGGEIVGYAYAGPFGSRAAYDWAVDYILTHCAPTSITRKIIPHAQTDRLTDFLEEVKNRARYHYWLFGHLHDNQAVDKKHILLWEQIVQVI